MEHYGSHNHNNISTSTPFSSLPSIAPQQLQQPNPGLPPHTLPPLQAHHGGIPMSTMYTQPLTAPHTPSTSAPNTPGSVGNGGYPQMGGHAAARGYQMPGNPYQQPMQSYNPTNHMMSQPPSSNAHQQNLAPAPAPRALMPIRPMNTASPLHTQHGLPGQMQSGMPSPYAQQAMAADNETPTHVVGSQGRRGILPSAPGRPAVAATGSGIAKSTVAPTKDADGKYPCPHCTKTYLHAKHLKRHLLRHTGDRPYMCVLCRDTFSRSDILKRHFQKCSIRRGNPTGASHLSHAQAHLKKNNNSSGNNSTSSSSNNNNGTTGGGKMEDDPMRNINGLGSMSNETPVSHVFGVIPVNDGASGTSDEQSSQTHLSRTNSLKRMSTGGLQERPGLPPSSHNSSNRGSFDHSYNGNPAAGAPSNLNPHIAAYHMTNAQSGGTFMQPYDYQPQSSVAASNSNNTNAATMGSHSNTGMPSMTGGRGGMMYGNAVNGQHSGNEWNQSFFQPGAHGFLSSLNSNLNHSQVPLNMTIKSEQPLPLTKDHYSGRYRPLGDSHNNTIRSIAVPCSSLSTIADPLHTVVGRIQEYCSHIQWTLDSHGYDLRRHLSASNVEQCFDNFNHFQVHFPMIQIATLDLPDAYGGLLLAMTCVGAVYSDCLSADQVREVMEVAKLAVERDVYDIFPPSPTSAYDHSDLATSRCTDKQLQNIQALVLLYSLFIWHGTPIQRERARRKFPSVVKLVQDIGLHQVRTSPQSFSILHQPNVATEHVSSAIFNWAAWVEQEKRSRTFFVVFLMDCAMTLYFNLEPQFDPMAVGLPLPCDDAAWEATSAQACADALGLRGEDVAHDVNQEGSRSRKQPEMHLVMRSLLDQNPLNATPTTNSYSKFVIVHAIHSQLWRTLKSHSAFAGQMTPDHSNSNSPRVQNDVRPRPYEQDNHGVRPSNTISDLYNKAVAEQSPIYSMSTINLALDSWKRMWDTDLLVQYPSRIRTSTRTGFCRDGLHFFYLAKVLLQNRLDLRMASDQRLVHVLAYLKRVKHWVVSDSAERGGGLGSVGDIDTNYGARDLTLDMSQLFRPLDQHLPSPSVSTLPRYRY